MIAVLRAAALSLAVLLAGCAHPQDWFSDRISDRDGAAIAELLKRTD